ncbi:hypothetical protein TNCT_500821 [Trichonephila clavata]|uniref:Uncharacterized protein n=1 Tax=Trichonephila clavata TaxID=2740835 RepID=A0A8X6F4V7_TRICU|nr:hypothetical protein TNCT_500821 [Trichonephila clavata]
MESRKSNIISSLYSSSQVQSIPECLTTVSLCKDWVMTAEISLHPPCNNLIKNLSRWCQDRLGPPQTHHRSSNRVRTATLTYFDIPYILSQISVLSLALTSLFQILYQYPQERRQHNSQERRYHHCKCQRITIIGFLQVFPSLAHQPREEWNPISLPTDMGFFLPPPLSRV